MVASDIPANREVFGDAAVFVSVTEVAALASAVRRALGDALLADQLRSKAVTPAPSFSVEFMLDEYERLLRSHEP